MRRDNVSNLDTKQQHAGLNDWVAWGILIKLGNPRVPSRVCDALGTWHSTALFKLKPDGTSNGFCAQCYFCFTH